ncbi:AAA family ATPase [Flavobacteriaceae bacterium]|nr:AAA family ATPase [Flavobacteriaceae bacterium]
MLKEISIINFALIDTLKVSFLPGMTSITGETGAGKSVILGALSLVLGKRADSTYLKNPEKKCIVEAIINISDYHLKDVFDSQDIDFETNTILRRELIPSGKSRAFINDTPVNLEVLNKISSVLIDVHSQNQTNEIFFNSFQFNFIDSLSNNIENSIVFKNEYTKYNLLRIYLKDLEKKEDSGLKELDYQNFLLEELESLNLDVDVLKNLENEVAELSNISLLQNKLSMSIDLINSDQNGVLVQLSNILNNIKSIKKFSEKYEEYFHRVDRLYSEFRDILYDFENNFNSLDSNPELLNEKSKNLDSLYSILNKHNVSKIEELIIIRDNLSKVVSENRSLSKKINETKDAIELKKEFLLKLSLKIHKNRSEAIPKIQNELKTLVLKLGMKNASFKFNLIQTKDFNEFGNQKLEFQFRSNSGTSFKPLKKIASGGEVSRIMLSIKYLTSKFHKLPTIIFDEIDTGVSGSVANEIGVLMKEMSESTQVLTITHIPQVAARGNHHIKIYKQNTKLESNITLKKLSRAEREDEIALMLSGKKMTISAKDHARELLD